MSRSTWDTDELIDTLGNSEPLYLYASHLGARGYNGRAFKSAFSKVAKGHRVDPAKVDWANVAAHFTPEGGAQEEPATAPEDVHRTGCVCLDCSTRGGQV